jgi:hypothetical protein
MEGRLSADAALADALRSRGHEPSGLPAGGGLPSCPEGHPSLPPAPAMSLASSLLPPAHPESGGAGSGSVGGAPSAGRRGSAGGASQHSGSFQAGTPRTPLSAEYAAALQRNSQRLLEAVASSASSGLGGSAENPVPLPEQETLMLPLAVQGLSPRERVRAHAKAAAEAGELPPEAEVEGPAPLARRPPPAAATPPRRRQQQQLALPEEHEGEHAGSGAVAATAAALATNAAPAAPADAAGEAPATGGEPAEAGDPVDASCTCPPFAVKATCGKRPIMEDTYALCPNICELPMHPMAADFADKLPQRIAVQLVTGEPSAGASGPVLPSAPVPGVGPPGGGSSAAFGAVLQGSGGSGTLEKLHFFGVYDGHGGIQASQHCAARLHHHLSVCLQEMAVSYFGHAPGGGPGGEAGGPVVPEVGSSRAGCSVVSLPLASRRMHAADPCGPRLGERPAAAPAHGMGPSSPSLAITRRSSLSPFTGHPWGAARPAGPSAAPMIA